MNRRLGDIKSSERLIQDVYLDLRKRLNEWAAVTSQTAQARMGYIGQHLVSIVTGFPGGKSGARGYDLVLPDGFAEIKTCYRVDQLGVCSDCKGSVSVLESACAQCGSTNIKRREDSKWLIGIRNENEFNEICEPKHYFLVLFEFEDLEKLNLNIIASIWKVDPKSPGFLLCMIDYYQNIRSASESKAPFNLWPYQLKFEIMKPELIYQSKITTKDEISTLIFPGYNQPEKVKIKQLSNYSSAKNLTYESVKIAARKFGLEITSKKKKDALLELEKFRNEKIIDDGAIADAIAHGIYSNIGQSRLPKKIKDLVDQI